MIDQLCKKSTGECYLFEYTTCNMKAMTNIVRRQQEDVNYLNIIIHMIYKQ